MENQILAAIASDNVRLVEQLVQQIPNVNVPVGESTFLHAAVEKGNINIVQLLLDSGCTVNLTNKNGLTPLLSSIENNKFEIFQLLKNYGSNLEQTDVSGASALHYAVQSGNIDFVKSLLDSGVNVAPLAKFDSTPLHIGVRGNNTAILKLLIEKGAPLEWITTQSYTALHIASMKGNAEVVKALLDGKAIVDARTNKRYTSLHLAALQGHQQVIEYLLAAGADPSVIDSDANKPSALARSKNFDKVAEILDNAEKIRLKNAPKVAVNVVTILPYTKELHGDRTKPTDLFFQPNEIIKCDDISQKDTWWEGELNGRRGTFPSNYVSSSILCKVVVSHNYYASRTDEINIKKGEEIDVYEKRPNNWWRGICGDKCGLFPSNHVTDIKYSKNVHRSNSPSGSPSIQTNTPSYPTSLPSYPSSFPSSLPTFPSSNPSSIPSFPSAVPSFPSAIPSYSPKTSIPTFPSAIPSAIPSFPNVNNNNNNDNGYSPTLPSQLGHLQKPSSVKKPQVGSDSSPVAMRKVDAPAPIKIAVPPPVIKPPAPVFPKARVLYAYEAQHPGDLALTVGTVIEITKTEGGWWEGTYEGETGIFPANYVELLP